MISILIATYNGSPFIKEQIDSILNQTYKNFEIVIVDDCSTDNTLEIISSIFKSNNFTNFKVYKNKSNFGPTKSFEIGVSKCNGEYIAISDQDDIWDSNKLNIYFNRICSEEIDLLFSPSYILKNGIYTNNIFPKKTIYRSIFGKVAHNNARGATMVIRTQIAIELIPFEDLYDKWLYLNCLFFYKIDYLDTPLHYYRIHDSNVNGGGYRFSSKNKLLLIFQNNINFYKKLKNKFKQKSNLILNFNNDKLFSNIDDIISLNESLQASLIKKNAFKIVRDYFRLVFVKEFTLEEKLIYFYYFFLKN